MYANNLEMPVTLYRSTDDDAPALTKSNLSLILKACLVTGYGSKPGAGWTMPYEDAAAKSYRDDTGAQAQDFFSLFAQARQVAGQYVAPVLLQRGERLYAVPGVHTNTRAADNLTVIDDEGAQYIILHSYGWSDIDKSFARLAVRTDKWRY